MLSVDNDIPSDAMASLKGTFWYITIFGVKVMDKAIYISTHTDDAQKTSISIIIIIIVSSLVQNISILPIAN